MACIPIYPPRGLEILREHIRLARARHEVQDMAAPLTYIWFFSKSEMAGRGITNKKIDCGLILVTSILAQWVMQHAFQQKFYTWLLAQRSGERAHQGKNGGMSCRVPRLAMTRLISSG